MPGARCTRSLVCAIGSKYAHEYSQRAIGNHPTFPHAMVYGLYRALPGDRLSCHRRRRLPANLTPASGCQDHTSSPSALATPVKRAAASTASRPALATFAKRPSVGQDGFGYRLICGFGKTEYFFKRGWTHRKRGWAVICPTGKSVGPRGSTENGRGDPKYHQ